MGCHALLQGIFQTQPSNPHLLTSPALAGGFLTVYWCRLCGWSCVCTRGEVLQRPPKGSRQPLVGSRKLIGGAGRPQGGEDRPQQVSSWAGKNTQGLITAFTSNTGSYLLAQEQSRRQAEGNTKHSVHRAYPLEGCLWSQRAHSPVGVPQPGQLD